MDTTITKSMKLAKNLMTIQSKDRLAELEKIIAEKNDAVYRQQRKCRDIARSYMSDVIGLAWHGVSDGGQSAVASSRCAVVQ